MSETTHASVPLSFFEYRATYRDPLFPVARLYSEVTEAVFGAFRPWKVTLDNVSYRQAPANLGEVSVTFSLLAGRVGFTVGLGSASMSVRDPAWSESGALSAIAAAGMAALLRAGVSGISEQRGTIAMHVKPASGTTKELVAELARPASTALTGEDVRAYGVSVYRDRSSWVIDASVLYPEALFLRIERAFGAEPTLEDIASSLREDEVSLLSLLRLDID